jgi:hypothetical protein
MSQDAANRDNKTVKNAKRLVIMFVFCEYILIFGYFLFKLFNIFFYRLFAFPTCGIVMSSAFEVLAGEAIAIECPLASE